MEAITNAIGSITISTVLSFVLELLMSAVVALLILFVGRKLIKWAMKLYDKFTEKSKIDQQVSVFLRRVINIALNVLLVILVVDYIGFETSSIMAAIGSAGLAIGLALQGSLSNFAGGVILLLLKPFKAGDFIDACGEQGTVQTVDIFYTKLLTADNKMVVIPNGALANANIENYSHEPKRRLDLSIGVEYSADINKVKSVLQSIADKHEMVLKNEDVTIFISSFDASCITMGLRVWVASENYWTLKFEMMEDIKKTFEENDIAIPFNQLDVNLFQK